MNWGRGCSRSGTYSRFPELSSCLTPHTLFPGSFLKAALVYLLTFIHTRCGPDGPKVTVANHLDQQKKDILTSGKKRGLFSPSHSVCPSAQNQSKMESYSQGQYRDKKGHLPHPSSCTWSHPAPENHSGPSHSSSVLDKPQ